MSNIPASSEFAKDLLDSITTNAIKIELSPGTRKTANTPKIPAKVCYVTSMTAADLNWIESRAENPYDRLVWTLIRKARDSSGEPVFTNGDKPALYERLPTDIAAKITHALYPTKIEDAEEQVEDPS